jgi:hypothetical protein
MILAAGAEIAALSFPQTRCMMWDIETVSFISKDGFPAVQRYTV